MPASFSESLEEFEHRLGYRFRNKALLRESLTHKSFLHENPGVAQAHNERLEFLGDSVLSLVVSEALFQDPTLFTEAEMSKMRSRLVNKSKLFEMASHLSLGDYLLLGRGEEATGGRQRRSVLANAMEAICGAVFLDSDYLTARSLIVALFDDMTVRQMSQDEEHDFKTELQEACQRMFNTLPEYLIVRQEGEEHRRVFTAEVYIKGEAKGRGTGKSKKEAQMNAAREALRALHQ